MDEFDKSSVKIISQTENGIAISSCAGRISTTPGTALSVFEKSKKSQENNSSLISKVLNSGHKTIIEHHSFSLVFNNVSVIVEQFLIEFRLTSFTIKSRRYVNFSSAGHYNLNLDNKNDNACFENTTDELFATYSYLVEQGIAKEDGRFILPYSFKSNILCTLNARELLHVICTMIYGRGRDYTEIVNLGQELKTQFEVYYPDLVEKEKSKYERYHKIKTREQMYSLKPATYKKASVKILSHTQDIEKVLKDSLKLEGMKKFELNKVLTDGKLSRILEQINFTFKIENISLASLTHLTRHRMQSLIVPNLQTIINKNIYVLPQSIACNETLCNKFKDMIDKTNMTMEKLKHIGNSNLSYLFVSAKAIDVITTMNCRELLWFFKLRTCSRAQWEIRNIATSLLKKLKKLYPDLFAGFGPSCLVEGHCTEGRLTCGKPRTEKDF